MGSDVELGGARLMLGDCLERMREVADGSVDAVLCDLPYGTTERAWESVTPFEPLWREYGRILKPKGAIVLTACQPFTTAFINSQPKLFRYPLVWDKVGSTGFLDARRPLRGHEDVLVFARGRTTYNPQFERGRPYRQAVKPRRCETLGRKKALDVSYTIEVAREDVHEPRRVDPRQHHGLGRHRRRRPGRGASVRGDRARPRVLRGRRRPDRGRRMIEQCRLAVDPDGLLTLRRPDREGEPGEFLRLGPIEHQCWCDLDALGLAEEHQSRRTLTYLMR